MKFNIISSGSKGNATVLISKETVLLIDMGISETRLKEGLAVFHKDISDIDVALFTHDHADHIAGIKFLSPKLMYSLKGTLPKLCNVVEPFKPFKVKDVTITALPTSHDATNPCGYLIDDGEEKMAYFTDTGVFPEDVFPYIQDPTYLIIESNHDIKMELNTNRSYELKNRVLGEFGHLCNEDSAFATCRIIGPHTKEIYLAHLSEEANTPEVALEAYKKIFAYAGQDFDSYKISCAKQWEMTLGGHYED